MTATPELPTWTTFERVWRSLKYEEVHLKAYADGHEARARHRRMEYPSLS